MRCYLNEFKNRSPLSRPFNFWAQRPTTRRNHDPLTCYTDGWLFLFGGGWNAPLFLEASSCVFLWRALERDRALRECGEEGTIARKNNTSRKTSVVSILNRSLLNSPDYLLCRFSKKKAAKSARHRGRIFYKRSITVGRQRGVASDENDD